MIEKETTRGKNKFILIAIIFAAVSICFLFVFIRNKQDKNTSNELDLVSSFYSDAHTKQDVYQSIENQETEEHSARETQTLYTTAAVQNTTESERGIMQTSIPVTNNLDDLEHLLLQKIQTYSGDWSLYVKYLPENTTVEINEQQMVAASLIKLFIMADFLEQAESGLVAPGIEAERLLGEMITVSDNAATNELVSRIGAGDTNNGRESVNAYCLQNGYFHTQQNRDLAVESSLENYTSAKDTGKILENIYRRTCISEPADTYMLDLLKAQQRQNKIPAGIPEGIVVANKTGELMEIENDAAIVFSPGGDYIFCVMSSGLENTGKAREQIVELSALIYAYFNP